MKYSTVVLVAASTILHATTINIPTDYITIQSAIDGADEVGGCNYIYHRIQEFK